MPAVLPKLGAIAVVLHQGQALLVQRSKAPGAGRWGFPGGHVEPGETALSAAVRELHEETGIIAEPLRYIANKDVIIHDETTGDLSHHYLLAATLCRYISGKPKAADDAQDARWVPFNAVATLPLNDGVEEVLAAALQALEDGWTSFQY